MRLIQLVLILAAAYSAPTFAAVQGVHCTLELSDKSYQPVKFDLSAAFPGNDSGVISTQIIPVFSAEPTGNLQVTLMVGFWRDDLSSPNANRFNMELSDYMGSVGKHLISTVQADPSAPMIQTIFGDTSLKGLQATGTCTSY